MLDKLLSAVRHTIKRLRSETDLLGAFRAKEYSHTAYFTGEFKLSEQMHMKVKVRFEYEMSELMHIKVNVCDELHSQCQAIASPALCKGRGPGGVVLLRTEVASYFIQAKSIVFQYMFHA